MEYDELAPLCMEALKRAKTVKDINNIRMAARFAWERKEMGGEEYVQFAHRNNTPIVPINHECHPIELLKRGFIDGKGWNKEEKSVINRLNYFRWPDGNHYYVSLDGIDICDNMKNYRFNTQEEAREAGIKYIIKNNKI